MSQPLTSLAALRDLSRPDSENCHTKEADLRVSLCAFVDSLVSEVANFNPERPTTKQEHETDLFAAL